MSTKFGFLVSYFLSIIDTKVSVDIITETVTFHESPSSSFAGTMFQKESKFEEKSVSFPKIKITNLSEHSRKEKLCLLFHFNLTFK